MGIFSTLSSLFGGSGNRKAIQQATNAANAGLQKGIDNNQAQQQANTSTFAPYTEAGGDATSAIADMLGLNGIEAQQKAMDGLRDSPLFKSRYDSGVNTILQNESATGGLRGGTTEHDLAGFGSELFGDVQQKQLSDLFGLSGEGLSAATSLAGDNSSMSDLISQLFAQQGQNSASGILGKHQATNTANNSVAGYVDNNISNLISALFPTGAKL